VDFIITQWINNFSGNSAALDQLMIAITTFGVPFMVLLVALQWWSKKPNAHMRHACVAAGLSFVLGLVLAQIMLLFIHRLRPYDAGVSHLIVPKTVDWSFPSDHAIASLSIVFALALQGLRQRSFIFLALATLVCVSRVFVGMHYASDILGGAGVALVAAFSVKILYRENSRLDQYLIDLF
jgi:undecaprenyl-diphosphatase